MKLPSHIKRICLLGGTGSLGQAVIDRLEKTELLVVSRDEQKLVALSRKYSARRNLKFSLGDVRSLGDVERSITDCDAVVYMAAVKHVPVCEEYPEEAVRTNILGALNVLTAVLRLDVSRRPKNVVAISTDKAVDPVNVYGMSKALQERVWTAHARQCASPAIAVLRYGNVLGSNGSIVPVIEDLHRRGLPITVTDPGMTRFLFTLEGAVDLILHAFVAEHGSLLVPKLSSCTVQSIVEYMVGKDYPVKIVGVRPGEKWHENLISSYEQVAMTVAGPASVGGEIFAVEQAKHADGKAFSSADNLLPKDAVFAYLRKAGVRRLLKEEN